MHSKWMGGVALLLGTAAAYGQSAMDPQAAFDAMDTDGNGVISLSEFHRGLGQLGWFDDWDTNNDGRITSEEFGAVVRGNFSNWDTSGDGALSKEEFIRGVFGAWDANADGYLTAPEWNRAVQAGWFGF